MPRYLKSPEEIIREKCKGIYIIKFADGLDAVMEGKSPEGQDRLTDWFKTNQPHVRLEEIGPSEFSGVISGGFAGDLYIDGWRDADIAAYSAAFEDERGRTRDAPWQVYEYPMDEYEQRKANMDQASCD